MYLQFNILFERQCMSRENNYLIAVLEALLTQVLKKKKKNQTPSPRSSYK